MNGDVRWTPLRVEHETRYHYAMPVELAHHVAFLRPLDDAAQCVDAFDLAIAPAPSWRTADRDVYGNIRTFFTATAPHDGLVVRATSRVRVAPRTSELAASLSPPWEHVRERLRYVAGAAFEPATEFAAPSPYVPLLARLADYAALSFEPGRALGEAAIDLMRRVHDDFRYEPAATEIHTPLAETFERRAGVCQDFSHLMIGALRAIGLAARYVSGYLLTTPRAGSGAAGAPLVGADASHAWVALWCPDMPGLPSGWLELDPTNDCMPDTSHVRLATGRDYGDVTPLRGVIRGGGSHTLQVRVSTAWEQASGV
jgi:transglutaminase-like putative cysteine protease